MRRGLVFALGWVLAGAGGAAGQATPYLPSLDPAHRDLDALVTAGWVKGAVTGQLPYSRLTVARLVLGARAHPAAASAGSQSRFGEALGRLEEAFAAEIQALYAAGAASCPPLPAGVVARSASVDVTWSDSPARPIPTSYDPGTPDYIDADLNPLLERNQGRVLVEGGTLGAEAVLDIGLGRHVAAQLRLRVWAARSMGRGRRLGPPCSTLMCVRSSATWRSRSVAITSRSDRGARADPCFPIMRMAWTSSGSRSIARPGCPGSCGRWGHSRRACCWPTWVGIRWCSADS